MKHGTKNDKGCNLGKKCTDFHPKMCPMSISKFECFDAKCNLCHVKGTKRKRDTHPPPKSKTKKSLSDEDSNSSQKEQQNKEKCPSEVITKTDDLQKPFLDQINLLKKEFQEVVDQKINNLLATTTSPPVKMLQPHYPLLPQPNMFQPFATPQHPSMMFHYPLNLMPHIQMQQSRPQPQV